MRTQTLGEIKLYTAQETISLLWSFRDKKTKFELGSNREKWPAELYNCIQFAKVIEGLRFHYGELKERYFFKSVTMTLYGSKIFSIAYDQRTCTMIIKTGLSFEYSIPPTEYRGVADFSGVFAKYLDSMILQMQRGLPHGLAQSLLAECKNLANNIAVKSSSLSDL